MEGWHILQLFLELGLELLRISSRVEACHSEFATSKRQPISNIQFTNDGNPLIISTEDGGVICVFQIRPLSLVSRARFGACVNNDALATEAEGVWYVYNLRQGRTSAVVEGVSASEDGRWIALGTRKRTVHVFAVNPRAWSMLIILSIWSLEPHMNIT